MLVPKQVTITSSFKAFGFRDGVSSGTDASVVIDIPPTMTAEELKIEMIKQKFTLDTFVTRSEVGKGTIPAELYQDIYNRNKTFSEGIIHGNADKE